MVLILAQNAAIVEMPGHPGRYTRKFVKDMWERAGSPPVNSAGRLYAEQKEAWDRYQAGTGSPADDPDRPGVFRLPHCRFIALDVDPVYAPRMLAAGFVRPLSYEPWHFEAIRDITVFPIVKSIPSTSGGGGTPFPEEEYMAISPEEFARIRVIIQEEVKAATAPLARQTTVTWIKAKLGGSNAKGQTITDILNAIRGK